MLVSPGLVAPAGAKSGTGGHGSGHGHTDVLGKPDAQRIPYPSHHPIRSAMGHHA
jgi:hypothetical protein